MDRETDRELERDGKTDSREAMVFRYCLYYIIHVFIIQVSTDILVRLISVMDHHVLDSASLLINNIPVSFNM